MEESKLIKCCNLTQVCSIAVQFHHNKLEKENGPMQYFHLGVIDTVWNIYVNLKDNQLLCENCLKFNDKLVIFRNHVSEVAKVVKVCEFCGRTVWGLATEYKMKNSLTEIPQNKYCCSKQIYVVDEKLVIFQNF